MHIHVSDDLVIFFQFDGPYLSSTAKWNSAMTFFEYFGIYTNIYSNIIIKIRKNMLGIAKNASNYEVAWAMNLQFLANFIA